MPLRSWLRTLEKTWIRPLARRLKLPRLTRTSSRLASLEERVEELEAMVRELTGLAYLTLDQAAESAPPHGTAAESQEAA